MTLQALLPRIPLSPYASLLWGLLEIKPKALEASYRAVDLLEFQRGVSPQRSTAFHGRVYPLAESENARIPGPQRPPERHPGKWDPSTFG